MLDRLRQHLRRARLPATPAEPWRPRHPALQRSWLDAAHPALRDALQAGDPTAVVDEVHPGVFTFPAWHPEACAQLDGELRALAGRGAEGEPPNTMHRYGAVLDSLGDADAAHAWMTAVIAPLAAALFPEVGGAELTDHHAFAVAYGPGADRELGFHVDESEVTFNLCLSAEGQGGDLYFAGRRCMAHSQDGARAGEHFTWRHQPGVAVLHAGAHRHGVYPMASGRRRGLIVWCRSPSHRASRDPWECAPWCGAAGR